MAGEMPRGDGPRERIFTLPNLLTLSRLPMAAALWIAPGSAALVIPLMIAAAVTDMADGRFARAIRARRIARGKEHGRLGEAGGIGAWLDPVCDKVFVVSLIAAVYVEYRPELVVVLLIAAREIFLVPMALAYKVSDRLRIAGKFDFRAGVAGKAATVSQFAAVASVLVAPQATLALAVAAGALGASATFVYARRGVLLVRGGAEKNGGAGQGRPTPPTR
jgi:cardiolipin synthase (CMP-forming)